jgi:transcriptional regulator with XRE-family HTH domain
MAGVPNFDPGAMARLRRQAGLGVRELAQRLEQFHPNVVAWEKGRVRPTPRHLARIAEALGVDPWQLTSTTPADAQLADLRAWAGMAVTDVAIATGMPPDTYSKVERALRPLGADRADRIAAAFGVDRAAVEAAYRRTRNAAPGRHRPGVDEP